MAARLRHHGMGKTLTLGFCGDIALSGVDVKFKVTMRFGSAGCALSQVFHANFRTKSSMLATSSKVIGISCSTQTNEFVIHIPEEYDYRFEIVSGE